MRSFRLTLPRTLAWMLLSVVLSGCEEPAAPTGKQQFVLPGSGAGVSHEGVSHEKVLGNLAERQQFVLELDTQFYDILENVRGESDVDHARQQLESLVKKARWKLRGYSRNKLTVKMSDAEYEKLLDAIRESVQSYHEKQVASSTKRLSASGARGSKSHIQGLSSSDMLSLLSDLAI